LKSGGVVVSASATLQFLNCRRLWFLTVVYKLSRIQRNPNAISFS